MTASTDQLPDRCSWLEPLLVAIVLGMTALMWSFSVDDTILLHVYYVPVVLTGFYLGSYQARLMSLLCISTALIIFVPYMVSTVERPLQVSMLIVFALWAFTLMLISALVGTLSDGWHDSLDKLQKAHRKDLFTDSLTGVANRRAFEYELDRRISDAERNHTPLTMLLIDIDHFKKFNDRYGHPAGDAVLRGVASSLGITLRQSDLVARFGGEEFVVLLPGIGIEGAQDTAERIRSLIETTRYPYNDLRLRLTVSLGIAQLIKNDNAESLIERADTALYSSKQAGRNCVHLHDGEQCRQCSAGIATDSTNERWTDHQTDQPIDSYLDRVSGLPTQKVFLEELRRRVAERVRYNTPLALAIVEFDTSEDHLGHASHAHNNLVAMIAKLASSVLRDTELVARFDTNSLAILLPTTSLGEAIHPLERLSISAANHKNAKYKTFSYAVKIGAVEVGLGEHAGEALQRVESTLSMARSSQHHRVWVHDGIECRPANSAGIAATSESEMESV